MTVVSSHSSSACRRKMPSAAARPAEVRCSSRPAGLGDEAVGDEAPEHLAGGLRGHAEVARDLGRGDPARRPRTRPSPAGRAGTAGRPWTGRAGRGGEACPQDTGPARPDGTSTGRRRRAIPTASPATQATTSTTPSAALRASTGPRPRRSPRAAGVVGTRGDDQRHRAGGGERREPRDEQQQREHRDARATGVSADMPPSQVAANRPQPVSSPISQPSPKTIGSQPTTAWTRRQRPCAVRSSVRARPRSVAAAARSGGGGGADRGVGCPRPCRPARSVAGRRARADPPSGVGPGRRPGRRSIATTSRSCGWVRARPAGVPCRGPRAVGSRAASGRRAVSPPSLGDGPSVAAGPSPGGRPAGPCLVLRSVLARIGVLLRVDASSTCRSSCRTSSRRPSRARTARRRRRRTRSSRASPCSGRGRLARRRRPGRDRGRTGRPAGGPPSARGAWPLGPVERRRCRRLDRARRPCCRSTRTRSSGARGRRTPGASRRPGRDRRRPAATAPRGRAVAGSARGRAARTPPGSPGTAAAPPGRRHRGG